MPAETIAPTALASAPRRHTKAERLLEMLRTDTGASLEAMTEVTGWRPHTVRAAMTRLRKRGIAIARGTEGTMTIWSAPNDQREIAQ